MSSEANFWANLSDQWVPFSELIRDPSQRTDRANRRVEQAVDRTARWAIGSRTTAARVDGPRPFDPFDNHHLGRLLAVDNETSARVFLRDFPIERNEIDDEPMTPRTRGIELVNASWFGQEDSVIKLLEQDIPAEYLGRALIRAVELNHTAIGKLLLDTERVPSPVIHQAIAIANGFPDPTFHNLLLKFT